MRKRTIPAILALGLAAALALPCTLRADAAVATPSDYPKDGWIEEGGDWRFYEEGDYVCDMWQIKDGEYVYLDENGYIARNIAVEDGSILYYMDADGHRTADSWVELDNGWAYFDENGEAVSGQKKTIDGKMYIFDDIGEKGRLNPVVLKGFVRRTDYGFEEINDWEDAVLAADYYCGSVSAESYKDNAVYTGWLLYKDKLIASGYDALEEIWFYFKSSGKKAAAETITNNGRKHSLDENGVLILGDLHVKYYPSRDNTNHSNSQYYNSGAEDALYEKPTRKLLEEYPEDKYTFLYWEDEEGNQYKIGDEVKASMIVYGVWEEIGKKQDEEQTTPVDGKQGGNTPSGSSSNKNETSTNVRTVGVGDYVTTSALSGLSVGNDVSGPYTSGRWQQSKDGTWNFKDVSGKDYHDEWAYVFTPYSTTSEKARWFVFDENGKMRTGWFTDKDGRTYYLNPDPAKGVEGEMMTGWVEIGGIWYYFNPNPDGTRGSLLRTSNTNPF